MIDESAVLFQAGSYSSIGQHERAVTMLTGALAEEPSNPRLLLALSESLGSLGQIAEAEDAARAALTADPSSIAAKLSLAWLAFRRGRVAQVVTLSEEILAVDPENAQAHLYVAIGLAYSPRRSGIAERTRAEYRAALALSRTAGYYYWAADIERRLRDTAAAKAHVAAGLELSPMHTGLLKMRVDQTASTEEKVSLLTGLLAMNPFDSSSLAGISEVYRKNRLSKYTLQWGLIFWITLTAGLLDGTGAIVVSVGIWVIGTLAWGVKNNRVAEIPPEFAAMRKSSFRFSVLTANLSLWWFIATMLGTILLVANGIGGGLFVVFGAQLLWALSHSIVIANDARNAILDSPLTEEPNEVPARLITLARSRSNVGIAAPLGLIVLALAVSWLGDAGLIEAQIAVGLVVLCAAAGLVYLAQGLVFVWSTKPRRTALVLSVVQLAIVGGLLGALFVTSFQQYSDALPRSTPAPAQAPPDTDELDLDELERRLNPTPGPIFETPRTPIMPTIPPLPTVPPLG